MDNADSVLKSIMSDAHESEIIEFKDRRNLDKDDMGRYYSALSNEANLKNADAAWMVFGITDKGEFVNSRYLDTVESRNKLKMYISEQTSNRMSYRDIHERFVDGKRVLLFEIPPCQFGVPTAFKGIAYERQGDGVLPLCDEKRIRIMGEAIPDWSKRIAYGASLDDLDPDAISMARRLFVNNRPAKMAECDSWDDPAFLKKMGLMSADGGLTNAAIVLLGKEGSSFLLGDVSVGMRCILRAADSTTMESEIYGLPFLLAIDRVCSEIHNMRYEMFRGGAMSLERMDVYDPAMIREALNNCVAHQDYLRSEYITVVEQDRESITFSNAGYFIPGTIADVLKNDSPARFYRNKCLAEAMFRLGMVDVAGGGIIKMCRCQAKRAFPLPEYDIGDDQVKVKIVGKVVNRSFADMIQDNPELPLGDIVLLDMVQKGKLISREDADRFLARGFVSGEYPDLTLGALRARNPGRPREASGLSAEVLAFIADNGPVSRAEIAEHVSSLLSDLSEEQRYQKLSNTLTALKKDGSVRMTGTRRDAKYLVRSRLQADRRTQAFRSLGPDHHRGTEEATQLARLSSALSSM